MINVLPEQGRALLKREYRHRLATLCLLALSVASLLASVVLAPIYWGERERRLRLEADLVALEASAKREADSMTSRDMSAAAAELPRIEEKFSTVRPSLLFADALSLRDRTISVERLEFTAGEKVQVRVTGTASTREALTAYARRLGGLPGVQVELPVSNLTKGEDAPFSLSLTFTQ